MTDLQVELHENLLGENKDSSTTVVGATHYSRAICFLLSKSGGVRHEDAASLEYQALF